jgi:DNA polymerase elongation subunit (family B)
MNNNLIFGKDDTQKLTTIEVLDGWTWLFFNDGSVDKHPYDYWFLTPHPTKKSTKLKGNLHYNYLTVFDDLSEYKRAKSAYYKKKLDHYKLADFRTQAMVRNGYTIHKGLKINEVSVLSFDIEAAGLLDDKFNFISDNPAVYTISNTFRDIHGQEITTQFSLDDYDNQWDMLKDWCDYVVKINPSNIIGHNIFGYDLVYLNKIWRQQFKYNLPIGYDEKPIIFDGYTSKFRKDGSQTYDYTNIHCFDSHLF